MLGRDGLAALSLHRDAFVRNGLGGKDQLRVLLCEGDSLLLWLGFLRPEDFSAAECRLLQDLVPAIRERLLLDRRIGEANANSELVDALLEELAVPAFLVRQDGAVVHRNRLARAQVPELRRVSLDEWRAAGHRVLPVRSSGGRAHFLVTERGRPEDPSPRIRLLASRWELTPRQVEVLHGVVEGFTNAEVAARLGCAVKTVEVHVSAVLAKAGAASRSELCPRVWTTPLT